MILQNELVFFIIFGTILFYQLNSYSNERLLSIIVIIIFAVFAYYYMNARKKEINEKNISIEKKLNKEAELRDVANVENPNITKFPKEKFKFVFGNKIMVEILDDLDILRIFDRARYQDLILYMDNLQKVYVYILANRYEPKSYIGTFIDLSDKVLELLYSLIFVIPENLRHIYGINTEALMKRNTERFVALRMKMIKILENYAKGEHNVKYLPEVFPRPSNNYNSSVLF